MAMISFSDITPSGNLERFRSLLLKHELKLIGHLKTDDWIDEEKTSIDVDVHIENFAKLAASCRRAGCCSPC